MKNSIYIFFVLISGFVFSQETLIKSFSSDANSIEITTDGLDEIKIINSESDTIEVSLFDENPNAHHILIDEDTSTLKISFNLELIKGNQVFKKFITKRLNRATVIIKLPKYKSITILGTNIDVISNNYNGNLAIYVEKGHIHLNKVQQSASIKLFQGNVFATISNSNIDLKSNKGTIKVNEKLHTKNYKKETKNTIKTFSVSSINANVSLTSK